MITVSLSSSDPQKLSYSTAEDPRDASVDYLLYLEDKRDDSWLLDERERERNEAEKQDKIQLLKDIQENEAILFALQGSGLEVDTEGETDDIPSNIYNNLLLERIGELRENEKRKKAINRGIEERRKYERSGESPALKERKRSRAAEPAETEVKEVQVKKEKPPVIDLSSDEEDSKKAVKNLVKKEEEKTNLFADMFAQRVFHAISEQVSKQISAQISGKNSNNQGEEKDVRDEITNERIETNDEERTERRVILLERGSRQGGSASALTMAAERSVKMTENGLPSVTITADDTLMSSGSLTQLEEGMNEILDHEPEDTGNISVVKNPPSSCIFNQNKLIFLIFEGLISADANHYPARLMENLNLLILYKNILEIFYIHVLYSFHYYYTVLVPATSLGRGQNPDWRWPAGLWRLESASYFI